MSGRSPSYLAGCREPSRSWRWAASAALIGLVIWLCVWTPAAHACRCAERTLAEYHQAADQVFFGRLTGVEDREQESLLEFEPINRFYKGGDLVLSFRTGSDSASCGIEPEIGIPFLVFAQQDPDRPGIGYVGTCNGTRRYSPESGQGSQGFVDVPARHVIPQLLDMMF